MPSLNIMLMMVISDLNRRTADGSVKVTSVPEGCSRALHVVRGCLVNSESTVVSERLGDVLASEGKLDPALIEPVANEARKRGTLLGHQLIADGLLTPTALASALDRQARLRLQNAMAASGSVRLMATKAIEPIVRVPLGTAVAVAMRERNKVAPIRDLIAARQTPIALDLNSEVFMRLELGPTELRICRALSSGQTFDEVIAGATSPDSAVRLIGVLVSLGLWS